MYASWLQVVAGPRFNELGVTNTEKVADIVQAGLGLCHLDSVFPKHLHAHLARPNEM